MAQEVDRLEQYSRRNCIVISGIAAEHTELPQQNVIKTVKKKLTSELNIDPNEFDFEIDKAHRIGPVNEDETQNITARFKSHRFVEKLYAKRKSIHNKTIRLKPSLTKKRANILKEASQLTATDKEVHFCFTDIHGNLKIRFKTKVKGRFVHTFNSEEDLCHLLEHKDNKNIWNDAE